MNQISPKDIDTKRIGHVGFFKEQFKNNLWAEYLLYEFSLPELDTVLTKVSVS